MDNAPHFDLYLRPQLERSVHAAYSLGEFLRGSASLPERDADSAMDLITAADTFAHWADEASVILTYPQNRHTAALRAGFYQKLGFDLGVIPSVSGITRPALAFVTTARQYNLQGNPMHELRILAANPSATEPNYSVDTVVRSYRGALAAALNAALELSDADL